MRPSRRKIAEVIADRLDHGEDSKRLSKEVAAYLLSTGRYNELSSLMRDVIGVRAQKGTVEAQVSLAHDLEDKVKTDIKKLVLVIWPTAKKIIITDKVEPGLIGGFKLNAVDKSLDTTIRAKLNKLKQLTVKGV